MKDYTFTSERLGFRNWVEEDKAKMGIINADPMVMEYFPSIPNQKQTDEFVDRMMSEFAEYGYCYFAVDRLDNGDFIGFIGILNQDFESDFTPCVDIGWRLSKKEWGKGFATEGASACLDFAFNTLNRDAILSICPAINDKSEKVMKKIGMRKVKSFDHPLLMEYKSLERCYLYEINKSSFSDSK